jgi:hypothetical protein
MYENAVKKEPNNEEWLSHLFMSYVRLGNYKRQQQVQSFFKQNSTPEPVQPDWAQWAIVYFVLILTKTGFGYILGDFFTNSSGHTVQNWQSTT